MAIPLQRTKLFIPTGRAKLVARPRLIGRLDGLHAEGCRAGLISAPAGSGKTTLVVQWLNSQDYPVSWLSLDARDNQPSRFFAYLIAALQMVVPGAGNAALSLLELPGASPEEIITLLTNDLVDAAGPFILALDDFHTITNPQLHQVVNLLIEAQPQHMRLVLLSREDPGMQLARRRARGQLIELRQDDLRFTLAEAVDFLNETMSLRLNTEQVEMLEARTEGWVAGLQMAALALQARADPEDESILPRTADIERFLQDFSGSQRFILDYLIEEVLAYQPAPVQSFLLETSILDRMCSDLSAAVTGKPAAEAQQMLEQIAKANLFVIPLDEERHWYRYHHLFHDLLLARLQAGNRTHTAVLELRASDWFATNGEPRLAVEYALRAKDPQRAADLVSVHLNERWQAADLEFTQLVFRLPAAVIMERPSLCLQKAWMCVILGQTEHILPSVEAAERALAAQDEHANLDKAANRAANHAFARVLRAYILDLANQPVELDESLQLALAAIPPENVGMRNSMAVVIGTITFMEGDLAAAMRYFEDALALDKRVNGTNAVPIATMRAALVLKTQGRLHDAVRLLKQSEGYVRERGSRRFYISGAINLLVGDVLLEWNRLDEAETQIRAGLRLLEDWPSPAVHCLGLSLMARLYIARDNLAEAKAALEQAGSLRQQSHLHTIFSDAIEQARVRLLLAEHNSADQQPSALEAWVDEKAPQALQTLSANGLRFRYEAGLIELCRVWLALGRQELAVELLERLAEAAQGRSGSRVTIMALLAAARSQNQLAALAALDEALRLGEPEGYLRTFVEVGEPLRPVLVMGLHHNRAASEPRLYQYAQQILASLDGLESARQIDAPKTAWLPEPLSQREQEVLRMVAQGLTNQQIADRLVLSIRTVKKHVENIHGKLGVQNRTQAAARARELGLLE